MKKLFSIIVLTCLFIQGNIHAIKSEISGSTTSPIQEIRKSLEKIENDFKQAIQQKQIIVAGSILVAIASYLLGLKMLQKSQGPGAPILPKLALITSVFSAALSTMVGIFAGTSLIRDIQDSQLNRIDKVLEERTSFTSLKELPQEQGMLFIATFRRNIPLMKLLIDHQPEFVNQAGVWKALTKLYFNRKPTSGRVQRLQEMIDKAVIPQVDIQVKN